MLEAPDVDLIRNIATETASAEAKAVLKTMVILQPRLATVGFHRRLLPCGPHWRGVPTGRLVRAIGQTIANRLFAPVWTVLYFLIAVSGWLVWREAGFAGAALPLAIYALQLVLNAAWTPLFFGLHRPDLGFLDIVLVWLSVAATIALFYPIHASAGLLLLPYFAWVTFAAALNFAVWRLNPSAAS